MTIDAQRTPPQVTRPRGAVVLLTLVVLAAFPRVAAADDWPATPVTFFGDRVVLGAEALVTAAPDDEGFFNYTDYDRSVLRLVRVGVTTSVRANGHVSFLAEVRAEGDMGDGEWTGEPYAMLVRIRPWLNRSFELHAGRIPTAFGGFLRRTYTRDNPLIGYPLAYQYLTTVRADAVPRNADDLIVRRGTGWYTGYSIGATEWTHGVPFISAFRYDTGVSGRYTFASGRLEVLGSVTTGTLSRPLVRDDNGSPQFAGRVVVRPLTGLLTGFSAARGAFLTDGLSSAIPAGTRPSDYKQQTFGADVEYSRGYGLLRAEWVHTSWRMPIIDQPALTEPLTAGSLCVEGRYTLAPGFYVAARADRLAFSTVEGTLGPASWDADVYRLETGVGYSLTRNVIVKGSYQYNHRDGGRIRRAHYGAAQLVLWF